MADSNHEVVRDRLSQFPYFQAEVELEVAPRQVSSDDAAVRHFGRSFDFIGNSAALNAYAGVNVRILAHPERPVVPLHLYRGAPEASMRRASWTPDESTAGVFATRRVVEAANAVADGLLPVPALHAAIARVGNVYAAHVPAEAVIGRLVSTIRADGYTRLEREVIVNPSTFPIRLHQSGAELLRANHSGATDAV